MKSIAITYTPYLTKTSAVLAAVIAISVLLYGIFLLEAVANTASRTAAERHMRELTSKISGLEGEYLAHTRAFTLAHAHEMGFVAPARTITVFAAGDARSLSASTGISPEGSER